MDLAHQAPLPMELTRQEYWSGLPFPSPGDLPDPRIEAVSPAFQADSLPSEPQRKPLSVILGYNFLFFVVASLSGVCIRVMVAL